MSVLSTWGSTAAERARPMPCDGLLPAARCRYDRAVTVDAPRALVYRWLCQLTLAPYSYDRIDNRGRRSPQYLVPGADALTVGQRLLVLFRLTSFADGDHLTMLAARASLTYAVRAAEDGGGGPVRIVARVWFHAPGGAVGEAVLGPLLGAGDLVMMRRQLLNLKALAERDARG